ncbi:MAG: SlyX family protein [Xanthomonadales bacterium]|nr:SlyX family protein [Xanthomonadales bacterium]
MESKDITQRVEELESQLAFQDELQSQLNEVVARQDREIAQLKADLKDLSDKLTELGEAMPGGGDAGDEPPPHY